MSKEWPLIEHLTDYLLRPRRGEPRHPAFWPSEASAVITDEWGDTKVVGKCRRATFFRYAISCFDFFPKYNFYSSMVEELKAKEIPTDRYMAWIWRAGQLYEDLILDLAKSSGVFIDTQIGIYIKEFNVSGKIDLVTINPNNHKFTVTEVKSVYGFGGNEVLGKPGERKLGQLGTPRHSNLMQIAIYDWWFASPLDQYEHSRLIYGSRDTGKYAEYQIRTEEQDGVTKIFYKGLAPNSTPEVESPVTINSILLDGYQYVQQHIDAGVIPPRDYELVYSEEHIKKLYDRQQLTKAETERYEKIQERNAENEVRLATNKKPLKELKPIEKGDWNCARCQWREMCYNEDKTPRNI